MVQANRYLPHLLKIAEGFDAGDIAKWRAEHDPLLPVNILTEKEFDLLQFSPSPLHKINAIYGTAFPIGEEHARRQLETDIIGQYAVLENSVRQGYYKEDGTLDSRLRKFGSIFYRCEKDVNFPGTHWCADFPTEAEIDRNPGIPIPSEAGVFGYHVPDVVSGIKDRLKYVYELKQSYSKLLQLQKIVDQNRRPGRENDLKEDYGFTADLLNFFGRDCALVLYGSTTYKNGKSNDYDVLVLVDSITAQKYGELEQFHPSYNGKPIDMVLVKKKEWEKFVVKNPFSLGIVKNGIVLHGEVQFPLIDRQEAVLRSVSRAVSRIRMLHGVALNVAASGGEIREGLYTSLAKVPRYMLSALLELRDLEEGASHTQYSKTDLEVRLAEMNIVAAPFPQEGIQDALFRIMIDTAKVVDRHYLPRWIQQHQDQIEKINHPSAEFFAGLEFDLDLEKRWQQISSLSQAERSDSWGTEEDLREIRF